MKSTIFAALLAFMAISASAIMTAAQSAACAPSGGLNFICGLQAPEDLVLVPDTRWLIASGMAAGSGLRLIDTQAKMSRDLFTVAVSTARADKTRFASCPGPLDAKQAVLHGLSLRPAQPGRYTLYATNHGGRESVEVFEVDARGAAPSAVWIGCVMMPDKLAANSVAAFPARNSCLKSAAPPRLRPPQVYIIRIYLTVPAGDILATPFEPLIRAVEG
jgi:hypothetical protein